jgi:hypothetical protein
MRALEFLEKEVVRRSFGPDSSWAGHVGKDLVLSHAIDSMDLPFGMRESLSTGSIFRTEC